MEIYVTYSGIRALRNALAILFIILTLFGFITAAKLKDGRNNLACKIESLESIGAEKNSNLEKIKSLLAYPTDASITKPEDRPSANPDSNTPVLKKEDNASPGRAPVMEKIIFPSIGPSRERPSIHQPPKTNLLPVLPFDPNRERVPAAAATMKDFPVIKISIEDGGQDLGVVSYPEWLQRDRLFNRRDSFLQFCLPKEVSLTGNEKVELAFNGKNISTPVSATHFNGCFSFPYNTLSKRRSTSKELKITVTYGDKTYQYSTALGSTSFFLKNIIQIEPKY